jgi:hypothetical protein
LGDKKFPISRQVSRQEVRILAHLEQYARTKFDPKYLGYNPRPVRGKTYGRLHPLNGRREMTRRANQIVRRAIRIAEEIGA